MPIYKDRSKQPSFNVNLVEDDVRLIYNAVDFYYKNTNFYQIDGSLKIEEITAKIDDFINV